MTFTVSVFGISAAIALLVVAYILIFSFLVDAVFDGWLDFFDLMLYTLFIGGAVVTHQW